MNVLAWPLTFLALTFMFPWARWLLCPISRNALLVALTTLSLSLGTLTQVMLWQGLIGLRIDWRITTILCAAISAAGWAVLGRTARIPFEPNATAKTGQVSDGVEKGGGGHSDLTPDPSPNYGEGSKHA